MTLSGMSSDPNNAVNSLVLILMRLVVFEPEKWQSVLIVGTICAQLLLQFYADLFETL